jgi:hypothetical protein
MNRVHAYAGWILALVATVGAVWFAQDAQRGAADMRRIGGELEALRQDLQKTRAAVDDLTARSAAAEKTAKAQETKSPDAAAAAPGLFETAMSLIKDSSPADAGKKVDVAGLVKGLMKANGAGGAGGLAAMFEGPQGEQMMDISAKMATNMQYDPFINGLQATDEQKRQVRDILNKHNTDLVRKSMAALGGKGDFAAAGRDAQTNKEQMRAELRAVLGDAGLEQFDAYQTEMPERMISQSMDMQLGMFAGGLTPENRTMVRDVLVQELLPGQPDPTAPASPDQMASMTESQRAAFDRALQRLQPSLPPEQYAEVEGFVRQQQDLMEMVAGMMPKPAAPAQ